MSSEDVLQRLDSSPHGLSAAEAARRLSIHGPNRLPPPQRRGPLRRLAAQFHNVLIYVLLAAAVVTCLLGHWVDMSVILGVVAINALIGAVQEGKAEKALEAIRTMLSSTATVVRSGRRTTLPAADLVPGDIVVVQPGDKVPADLRLLRVKELRIEEAALTGESVPVDKSVAAVPANAVVGDRTCVAFSGTLVSYGQGSGVIVATGSATEIGRISGLLAQVQPLTTKLLQKIASFGRWLTVVIVALAVATFFIGVLGHGFPRAEMFTAVVGLAVAAIPEGLPAIITITLAVGVQRMAARRAIIRRLPAVEALGAVTVICSDKTGTLTRNEMTAKTVVMADRLLEVGGVGYEPAGAFVEAGADVAPANDAILGELVRAGSWCNDATLQLEDGRWLLHGDPTEGALVCLAMKAGLDPNAEREAAPAIDIVPFETAHGYMATLHDRGALGRVIYVKGAPERLLTRCTRQRTPQVDAPLSAAFWRDQIELIAGRGQRTLAIACKTAGAGQQSLAHADVATDLTLLGLVGIIDPPRTDAIEAVRKCREAGIQVKMITGDHATTARVIGAQMGIGDGTTVLTGQEMDALDPQTLRERVNDVDVFARVSPEHKLDLVKLLQARGEVVTMTGDGVNDAPALKRADVGVAMGVKGTEAAKEAAEMVLADDNFASIERAVEEGRTVYDNIRKAFLFILPTNAAEAGIIVTAVALGRLLPITALQILWVNMITAVTLALSLAFEPSESDVMKRPPRHPAEPILSRFLLWRISFVATLFVAGTFGLFLWERLHGAGIEAARTVAVNTLVMFEAAYLLNTRFLRATALSRKGLLGNRYALAAIGAVIVLQVLFSYTAPMQRLFATAPLGLAAWGRIAAAALLMFLLVELEKQYGARLAAGRLARAAGRLRPQRGRR